MSNRNGFLIAVVMVAGLLGNPGMADAGSTDGDLDDEIDCFRAQGCPRCNASFLLELNLARGSESCGEGPWAGGAAGVLRNIGRSYGLGGKIFVGGDDCGMRYGMRMVGRRWITPQISLEVAPGVAFGGDDQLRFPAFSLQLALDIAGVVAPIYHMEMIRPKYGGESHLETMWGVRVSSYAGVVAGIGLGIALAIAISSMSSWSMGG